MLPPLWYFKNLPLFIILRVNKTKITGENTFNGNHFETEGNHGLNKDKKTLF